MSESETKEELEAEEEEVEVPGEEVSPEEPSQAEQAEEQKAAESPPAAEEEEGEGEEEIEIVEEKFYTIPLRYVWLTPRGKRAPRTVRYVREYVTRHMKAEEVAMSNEINEALWSRGINKPPRRIRVRAVKDKEGKVIVYPATTA